MGFCKRHLISIFKLKFKYSYCGKTHKYPKRNLKSKILITTTNSHAYLDVGVRFFLVKVVISSRQVLEPPGALTGSH